jgi:CheY-like chemotaxis protein
MDRPLALIADDHGDSAIIFSEALQMAGFATEIARSGTEALARLADATPDVVILDLWLPLVDGTEILERICADDRLASVHVIVVSADPILAETTLSRADRVLVKPVSFLWLRKLAVQLIDQLGLSEKAARAGAGDRL